MVLEYFWNIGVEALNILKWELFRDVVISSVLEVFCELLCTMCEVQCNMIHVCFVCFRCLFEHWLGSY